MKHFFALPAILRVASILATASQQSFSVNDDLLAFPQYEIRLGERWISEKEAQARLLTEPGEVYEGDQKEDSVGEYHGTHAADDEDAQSSEKLPIEYEYMVMDGQRWLCNVPLVNKSDETDSSNETMSRAEKEKEQQKEIARATDRGWELLSEMKGNCIYFVAGWWSYKFCYSKGVKQFHQLPPSRSVQAYPPVEDPNVQGFVLGTYDKRVDDDEVPSKSQWTGESAPGKNEDLRRKYNGSGELVQRGESRYLVQHLGGGTVCDLTGRERNVEIQYHCNPQSGDKISLIKETTTCAYLMVIQTPRLCHDVAFLPPQKDQSNSVFCSPILMENEVEAYEKGLAAVKAAETDAKVLDAAKAAFGGGQGHSKAPPKVGDILVGAHALIPKDQEIEKSSILGGGKETFVDTVASSDGRTLTKQDLERLGLKDPKTVDRLRKELEKIADGRSWKLNLVDTARGREYKAVIGDEDEDEAKKGEQAKETKKGAEAKDEKKAEKTKRRKFGSDDELLKGEL